MPSKRANADTEFGSDSFLDVMANMVGIMIILVMIAGVRVQRAAVARAESSVEVTPVVAQPSPEVKELVGEGSSLTRENLEMAAQMEVLSKTLERRARERDLLALAVNARGQALAQQRSKLDEETRRAYDAQRLSQSKREERERLSREIASISLAPETVTKFESLPTPFAKTVNGREAHFLLSGGRIVHVPVEALAAAMQKDARGKMGRLRQDSEFTGTTDAIEGFRAQYTIQRVQIRGDDPAMGVVGAFAKLKEMSMLPVSEGIGETTDAALASGSEFRRILASQRQGTTVTLWTHPDSFAPYHQMRKELFRLGIPTAGRPLPEGHPITGSPEGSESLAE